MLMTSPFSAREDRRSSESEGQGRVSGAGRGQKAWHKLLAEQTGNGLAWE